jgi:S1-C subfamily serine protease
MSKVRYALVVVLFLVSISLVIVGCGTTSPSSASGYLQIDRAVGPQLTTQELVAEVAPAVVSIVVETVSYNWFWQAVPQTGAGSGIIVSPDGYIVTNCCNHTRYRPAD